MKKYILISVTDKTDLIKFVRSLQKLNYEILTTLGTFNYLKENNIDTIKIEDFYQITELLEGRVKTFHPNIYAGILADKTKHLAEIKTNQIILIEMVVINLYSFENEPSIENIDIGGVSLLRSAAKNYKNVISVCDINDYEKIIELLNNNNLTENYRLTLAQKTFNLILNYDQLIKHWFDQQNKDSNTDLVLDYQHQLHFKYGENNNQDANCYVSKITPNWLALLTKINGLDLTYNNLVDIFVAIKLICLFFVDKMFANTKAMVAIKHQNPCAFVLANDPNLIWSKILISDHISIFGSIVATDLIIDLPLAQQMVKQFIIIIIATDFTPEAQDYLIINKPKTFLFKTNFNLLSKLVLQPNLQIKSLTQALVLTQQSLTINANIEQWTCPTILKPTPEDLKELKFVWNVVAEVVSNAIVIGKNLQTLGVGVGQMNRVSSVKLALQQAQERSHQTYLASDGFFPFADSIELLKDIRAIVQPGGSINDQLVIDKANELGLIMVMTNERVFKH